MSSPRRPPWPTARSRAVLALAALALASSGCYSFSEPSFAPGDQRDLLQAITRRGVVVESTMPGQAACSDPDLIGNVLYLKARMADETEPRDVYIHGFRERSWEASKAAVDACQAEYAADHPAARITRLDVPVWRAFGADWSQQLTTELHDALEEAAQAGR